MLMTTRRIRLRILKMGLTMLINILIKIFITFILLRLVCKKRISVLCQREKSPGIALPRLRHPAGILPTDGEFVLPTVSSLSDLTK